MNIEWRNGCKASGRTKAKETAEVLVKPKCSNCEETISEKENQYNKGYCNECTYEAVGEGEVTW